MSSSQPPPPPRPPPQQQQQQYGRPKPPPTPPPRPQPPAQSPYGYQSQPQHQHSQQPSHLQSQAQPTATAVAPARPTATSAYYGYAQPNTPAAAPTVIPPKPAAPTSTSLPPMPATPAATTGMTHRRTPDAASAAASSTSASTAAGSYSNGSGFATSQALPGASSYYAGASYATAGADHTNVHSGPGVVSYSSPYVLPPSSYATPVKQAPSAAPSRIKAGAKQTYDHNALALLLLLPTFVSILWWHESPLVLQLIMIDALILYALDLSDFRDALVVAIWISALFLTMLSGFGNLLQVDDADASGSEMILQLLKLAVEGMFFCCMACWGTLQFEWLHKDVPSVAIGMERSLHSALPPLVACIGTFHVVRLLSEYWGLDRVATFAPHLFAAFLAIGMYLLGTSETSFELANNNSSAKPSYGNSPNSKLHGSRTQSANSVQYCITATVARIHSMLLLLVPGLVHILMFRHRILSRNASMDDIYDVVLVWTVPYMLHFSLIILSTHVMSFEVDSSAETNDETSAAQTSTVRKKLDSPYVMKRNNLFPQGTTLRGALIPMGVSLLGSWALQQRYLIPLCHTVAYQFNGHDLASTTVVSMYLTAATLAVYFAVWMTGRVSNVTNEPLFGEYQEDLIQLCIASGGLLFGKAFGMPWGLTPLPILSSLGLSVWMATRMLRYLSIFLFVVHASGVVVFNYRFAVINETVALAMPFSVRVPLVRFGMTFVAASVLIGLVTGLAVRPAGGPGASILKRLDANGILACVYALLLTILELTLLKHPVPSKELVGQDMDVSGSDAWQDEGYLYDHATAMITSLLLFAIAFFYYRQKIASSKASMCLAALAIGKAVAVITDASELDGGIRSRKRQERKATQLFFRAMVTTIMLIVMFAPRAILSPIYMKTSTGRRRRTSNMVADVEVPTKARKFIYLYSLVIMPITLMATVPYVLTPLIMAFSKHYGGGAYYSVAPPFSELIGFALALWGIALLSMLSHYLPDGGAETWKRVSMVMLAMGVGIALSAPSVPEWIRGTLENGVSNPYASISSVGSKLSSDGTSRTGGWGILVASLATLLAVTGPLELRERRSPTGKKDNMMLFRMMMFSMMFGSGVSWFVTMQGMSQASLPILIATGFGSMAVSFFATVVAVLSYFLELENFDEVDQVSKIWVAILVVFTFVVSAPHLLVRSLEEPMFGVGGWMSTFLTVASISALSIACALRARPGRDRASRKLGNLNAAMAWLLAITVLYGGYGVAGLDDNFDVTTILGIPVSILGTFLVAPMLLALEGEVSNDRRRTVQRVSNKSKPQVQTIGFTIDALNDSNRLAPPVIATCLVLFIASLYVILLRGLIDGRTASIHKTMFANLFDHKSEAWMLAELAERSISYSAATDVSTKLAASGIWTCDNIFTPLVHLGGLAAALPSLFLVLSRLWKEQDVPSNQFSIFMPLTLIPTFVCTGIPSLRALGFIGLVGSGVMVLRKQITKHSQQRI